MEFPRFVYLSPGNFRRGKNTYRYLSVRSLEEHDAYLAQGWSTSADQAIERANAPTPAPAPASVPTPAPAPAVPEDNAPPTRVELETKAREIGLKFDGRTSDRTLLRRITQAIGEV
jgi:hypothetical protein